MLDDVHDLNTFEEVRRAVLREVARSFGVPRKIFWGREKQMGWVAAEPIGAAIAKALGFSHVTNVEVDLALGDPPRVKVTKILTPAEVALIGNAILEGLEVTLAVVQTEETQDDGTDTDNQA